MCSAPHVLTGCFPEEEPRACWGGRTGLGELNVKDQHTIILYLISEAWGQVAHKNQKSSMGLNNSLHNIKEIKVQDLNSVL